MHKLDRTGIAVPACLTNPQYTSYAQLRRPDKTQIRQSLFVMQGERCAYCERRTGTGENDGHIEHFRNQANHTHLTLNWHNLYWSCNDPASCGKHKDDCNIPNGTSTKAAFLPSSIIDPGVDNPDDFFVFVYDGEVKVKDGLSPGDLTRAKETLRIFQIADSSYLRKSRADAVRSYVSHLDLLNQIAPQKISEYATSELAKTQDAPFCTTIRHFLTQFAC